MELPHIGQNCALKECNQLDFLPVRCDACSGVFCVEHYLYEQHNCDKARDKDFQVPVCPLCMEPVTTRRGQLPDISVSGHIDQFCKGNEALRTKLRASNQAKQKTNLQACSHKSCKQKDLIYLECSDCKAKFCIKHRHPTDHSCVGPKPASIGSSLSHNLSSFKESCSSGATSSLSMIRNRAQQLTKSGQAALNRLASTSNAAGRSTNSNSQNGIHNLPENVANNLQGGLSEQEALAQALRDSIATNHGPVTNGLARNGSQIEDEDSLLARAIHESELEARRRQLDRRPQKDACTLS